MTERELQLLETIIDNKLNYYLSDDETEIANAQLEIELCRKELLDH